MTYGDVKEQVRSRTDIVELIGRSLDLRRSGRVYEGLCPWHNDRKPSLKVNPDRQTWKCWVCDIGGDVFSFVMKRENCDFREALQMLAEQAGISLGPQHQKKVVPGSPDDKQTLYQCCDWAATQFHEYFLKADGAAAARQYVAERHISPASIERFRIGFAPREWTWLLDRARNTPFSPKVLEGAGLVRMGDRGSHYDWFRGRIMFPIRDPQGRTIAFGGRILPSLADDDAAKYINSPETRLYSKSDTLYALDLVRMTAGKTRQITVVEGYTDVILCHQHGVDDVVACCGTALGPRHIQLLKRFADTVYLVLDGDAAGQRRTNEILELFVAAQMDLRIMTPPDGLDPADFLAERGGEAFRALLADAVDALEHKIRTATAGIDLALDTHRASQALEEILATIARGLPSGAVDAAGLRAQQLVARLARQFALDEAAVRARFGELRKKGAGQGSRAREDEADGDVGSSKRLEPLSLAERELLEILVLYPELAPTALADIADADLASATARELFATYRRLEESGHSLDFHSVLSEIEDPQLKHTLVEIDDLAHEKASRALLEPLDRLRSVIRQFHKQHELRELRRTEAALEQRIFNPEEELDVLANLIATKRRQQGISG